MLNHTSQSLFLGCIPMGAATLINSALVRSNACISTASLLRQASQALNQNWGFGGRGFLYTLWGLWWLDSALSYLVAFGMLYTM